MLNNLTPNTILILIFYIDLTETKILATTKKSIYNPTYFYKYILLLIIFCISTASFF